MRNLIDDVSGNLLAPDDSEPEPRYSVLLIVAGRMQGESLRHELVCGGFDVNLARSVSQAFGGPAGALYDAVVLDWQTLAMEFFGSGKAQAWTRLARELRPCGKPVGLVVIVDSGQNAPPEVEQPRAITIARGAADRQLGEAVERAIGAVTAEPFGSSIREEPPGAIEGFLLGRSEAIRAVFEQVRLVAHRDTTVLITGETGTGKERVSRAIHHFSRRGKMEMVSINCGGIPATLLEDELFGHVKGAFTDARQSRMGRFEQADRGTIFLDEIGDLPIDLQPKLLRVLQEREIHRIGGVESLQLDVRVIAATNVDLWKRVEEGRFREDLFYRINVYHIHMPPLRERAEDIPLFIHYFLEKFCRRDGLPPKRLRSSLEAELARRPWRGNIRELENAVEIAAIRSEGRTELTEQDFPPSREAAGQESDWPLAVPEPSRVVDTLDFKALVNRYERDLILRTLELTQGNKNKAAQMLRLKRTTLIEKLKRFEA